MAFFELCISPVLRQDQDIWNFYSSLLRGTGPVILETSCMPLHISLDVGLKVVNVIEEAAIVIDNESKP